MSYYKIAATPPATLNKIRFYYEIDTLLARVEKVSSYKAAALIKENGQTDYDRVQASVDERDLMLEYLQKCMLEMFDMFFHLVVSNSITNSEPLELPDAATIVATDMIIGNYYTIVTPNGPGGSTDFTLCGATGNTAGEVFVYTGGATGTGTVKVNIVATYVDIKDNAKYRTINIDLIDNYISGAAVDYLLAKWYILKGLVDDAKVLLAEYQNALSDISKRTLALRQY